MDIQRYTGQIKEILNNRRLCMSGLTIPALARLGSEITNNYNGNIFILLPTPVEVEDFIGDLLFFQPELKDKISHLSVSMSKPFIGRLSSQENSSERSLALYRLSTSGEKQIIVSSVGAALRLVPQRELIKNRVKFLQVETEIDLEGFKSFLSDCGYLATGQVESRGDFSARGGVLDFFPPGEEFPLRLELFGDFIESIKKFKIHSQRSIGSLNALTVLPIFEVLYDEVSCKSAADDFKQLAIKHNWLDLLWKPLYEKLNNRERFYDLESWSPLFNGKLVSPLSLLSAEDLLIIYEPGRALQKGEDSYLSLKNHFDRLSLEERPHLPLNNLYQSPENLFSQISNSNFSSYEATNLVWKENNADQGKINFAMGSSETKAIDLASGSTKISAGITGALVARLKSYFKSSFKVRLVLRTKEQLKRLSELLADYDLSGYPLSDSDYMTMEIGQLSKGFSLTDEKIVYLTEDEIFGRKVRYKRKAAEEISGLKFASLKDLNPGDFIVHNFHGIGQYQGLVNLTLSNGQKGDFLHLTYKGGDKLYVPVERFAAISKYIGAGDGSPSMDKLGAFTWQRLKEKVKENIRQMAEELLKLYAKRELSQGFAFSEQTEEYKAFEDAFEYVETPDQLKAIQAVLADMANERPMDRLICGDVGYGKTEVAMRAAFKAVESGKQVAVLVPTTVLAEQHGKSFIARMADWPVRIESLSRFKKASEQKEILKKVAKGEVDIVIGTHRLLQNDVKFKDLGLAIIDEEHRFGVVHKEKFKQMRASVDVLSMSATPIPRSLSMSLAGLRDFSPIETPPEDRLPVITTLLKYDDEAICEAIDKEIARGGQCFIIHNRVSDIHLLAEKLHRLMPLVRFGIGHGQMKEKELEEVMGAFLNKEIDVWISTTILESGLDFPGANTIIINHADKFGLAQLYQLRGRVGRGGQQAYAYLLVDNPETLPSDAEKRLRAILDHSELGSGYQIAMHDLQIRGSGNILGSAQSGQAALVGYEMYNQLMEEAINEAKGLPYEEDFDPELVIGLPAYLPENYAPEPQARIVIYRRLASVKDQDEILALDEEIKDRFGVQPIEVKTLLSMAEIKLFLKKAKVAKLESGAKGLTLSFKPEGPANYDKVMSIICNPANKASLTPNGKMFIADYFVKTYEDLDRIKHFLSGLS